MRRLVCVLLVCFRAWQWQAHVTAPTAQAQSTDLQALWARVYHPDRLRILQARATVTGVIVDATAGKRRDGVRKEADGDCHGWVRLDPGQESYLNAGNMSDEQGNLVYEVVCLFPVTQADAVQACQGYKSPIKLAPVGAHVRISGSWVQDTNHAKWNEIHPVSSIDVIPSALADGKTYHAELLH